MKFLLDTNVISEIRKRDRAHPNVARRVARAPVKDIGTSVVVLAEIRRGIELKRRINSRQAEFLDRWFAQMRTRLGDRVLPIDEPIAEAWAIYDRTTPSIPLAHGDLDRLSLFDGRLGHGVAQRRHRSGCGWNIDVRSSSSSRT